MTGNRRYPLQRSSFPIKRSPIKRARPIESDSKRQKRIAYRSQRALDKLPERARVVDRVWERDGGRCRAEHSVHWIRCGGRLDAHEVIPRSAWPGGELVESNVMLVCRNHHDWIGDNPTAAHAAGLHGFSWERLRVVGGE